MKEKKSYVCSECGYTTAKWMGRCPECGQWNTFEEHTERSTKTSFAAQRPSGIVTGSSSASRLKSVKTNSNERIVTGISEYDRVMGGGIVRDSVSIITSPPGGGKSTLALNIASRTAEQGYKILYASGEESEGQIKTRADRILDGINDNIWILSTVSMNAVLNEISAIDPDIIIIDSIQTFVLEEFYPSRAGNPTQTMECAGALVQLAKGGTRPRAVIIIGQMNKSDELAGLRALEHLVDTVLIMEGDTQDELRSLYASKNRFGSTGEMGFFSMTEKGLVSIENPSEFFMTKRAADEAVSGSALTVVREGSRPIICEIESLVSKTFMAYPSRIGEALRREQLNTLVSILEVRCGIKLYDKDVVIKITGGLKPKEQSVNLAVLMSIVSSVSNKPIPNNTAFIADVGLTGELKKVPAVESRIRELARMGFQNVFLAKSEGNIKKPDGINVYEMKTLKEVIISVFGYI
ncbi:MAG: DNA repair protein RadA [Clostridia bacterium]|nr:DNA repair protein RadA [Clostridia bacterium]